MYIYIDSKIKGTFSMLIDYFNNQVFDRVTVTVLCKVYKENNFIFNIFNKNKIKYIKIYRYKDLPSLTGKTVLYLFNAQSNCRLVSYREATHIFVGHGESNKLASAKPIFRIYDYIAVAGDASIDRFVEQKIFTKCDVEHNKFIKVGNAFLGKNRYEYSKNSKVLLYAPTWEGGVKEENFSSITKNLESFHLIAKYAKENNYHNIIIQPHPNTGHRDKKYKKYLLNGIKLIKSIGLEVYVYKWKISLLDKLFLAQSNILKNINNFKVGTAFCDVSAMELQLIDKNIPTFIFFMKNANYIPDKQILKDYYNKIGIVNWKSPFVIDMDLQQKIKSYYISNDTARGIGL